VHGYDRAWFVCNVTIPVFSYDRDLFASDITNGKIIANQNGGGGGSA